jgi:hypothetical protein
MADAVAIEVSNHAVQVGVLMGFPAGRDIRERRSLSRERPRGSEGHEKPPDHSRTVSTASLSHGRGALPGSPQSSALGGP